MSPFMGLEDGLLTTMVSSFNSICAAEVAAGYCCGMVLLWDKWA